MTLDSLSFILFMLVAVFAYWKSPVGWRKLILIALSVWFYSTLHAFFGITVFWSATIAYLAGLAVHQLRKKSAIKSSTITQPVMAVSALGIVALLLTLIFFKYLRFWAGAISAVIPPLEFNQYLLPIGISFYTFQLVGYLVDVFKHKYQPETNPLNFLLFVLFFPKLLAGPIERGDTLLPQIKQLPRWNSALFVSGCKLFILGVFKKKVIADNLAVVVDRVFDNLPQFKGLSLVLVMIIYAWQIYADFSGYTDMARGAARVLGFNLLENFNLPYISKSVREFWRRWHISLSNWLRDYLYFPLGGSRVGFLHALINVMIVFVICGIWHGATINFVIWGGLHGLFISFERIVDKILALSSFSSVKKSIQGNVLLSKVSTLTQTGYAFTAVTLSWVVFRARTLNDALYIFSNALVGAKNFFNLGYIKATLELMFQYNYLEMGIAGFVLVMAIVLELLALRKPLATYLKQMPVPLRFATYVSVLTLIILMRQVETTDFIYVIF